MHLLVPSQGVYGRSRQHLSWHYVTGSFVLLVYAAEKLCPQFISCGSINKSGRCLKDLDFHLLSFRALQSVLQFTSKIAMEKKIQ